MSQIMILNGIVITMDSQNRVIKNGAVFVDGEEIIDVGKSENIKKKYKADVIIDATRKVVLPGFVNAHTHLHQTFLRGLGHDLPLYEWIQQAILASGEVMTANDLYLSALLGYVENIRSGNTTVLCHHYLHTSQRSTDLVARAAKDAGVRTVIARSYCDQVLSDVATPLKPFVEPLEAIRADSERLIKTWHNRAGGKIHIWPGPLTFDSCSLELWAVASEFAAKYKLGIHVHMNEVKKDVEFSEMTYGKRPFEVLADRGFLGPNLQAAHSVWVSKKEVELIRENNVKVVHNPVANMYLASGVAPIPEMLSQGIKVALGTDGPASNNNQDMLTCMKFAACLHKVYNLNATSITAGQVLKMATVGGAEALMMERNIGSLEPGKKADIALINFWKTHIMPVHEPMGALVYCANMNDVDTVLIDGKLVMENGNVKSVDEDSVIRKSQQAADRIAEEMNNR